jgi:Winged helix DNA-binding domain
MFTNIVESEQTSGHSAYNNIQPVRPGMPVFRFSPRPPSIYPRCDTTASLPAFRADYNGWRMANPRTQLNLKAISRFRLGRHHLFDEAPADAVSICRDICGVQAQVMSSAFLQLWARNHAITRAEIETALWQARTLVKTSLMRQTLHLIPADEFLLYIAALKPSRMSGALRIMEKFGIARDEAEALTILIMDALSSGPLGRPAITAAVRPKVSKRVRSWMENVWSIVRVPVAEGLICYGRGESKEVSFIRVDHWLPNLKSKPISGTEAQCTLFRKYLRAYGPATPADFSHWSGIPMQQVRPLRALLEPELEEVPGGNKSSLLLREDVAILKRSSGREACIRLLPSFDTYLLAHRAKDHLLSTKHYKRVYRNQGWISPVLLIDGAIAGVWSHKVENKKLLVEIEPLSRLSPKVRSAIKREGERLAIFFARELEFQSI